ncbi:type I 3-dehydroquinate dehydratase [Lactobacillaceae bacterium Scapto_B20]
MKPVTINQVTLGDGQPKIAVSITQSNLAAIKEQLMKIKEAGPDLVEWRIDYLPTLPTIAEIKAVRQAIKAVLDDMPVIATFRTVAEGGNLAISESDYFQLLHNLTTVNFEIIDVEIQHDVTELTQVIRVAHERNQAIIGSFHDFDGIPDNDVLSERFNAMQDVKADIAKVAVMPPDKQSVLNFMNLSYQVSTTLSIPIVSMAMGSVGALTRVSGSLTESAITFGSLNATTSSAPGQIPVKTLRTILNLFKE